MQQAEKLDELLKKRGIAIDRVLNFDVPDSTLVSVSAKAVLHLHQPCAEYIPPLLAWRKPCTVWHCEPLGEQGQALTTSTDSCC